VTAFVTAVAAFVLFAAVFFGVAWLITASPLILVVVVAATIAFVLCIARQNRRDGW